MRYRFLIVLLALVLVLSGCASLKRDKARGEIRQVTVAMGFIPNVQFAPMYVAIERGYFGDEGLEVVPDYGMETDLLLRVGTNDLQFAVASGDQVVLARANDLPVTYVMNWYRRFPVCVVTMASAGITEPGQLVGKTVGIPATEGASYIGWLALLEQMDIQPDQVNLQAIGYTQTASLVEGRVDAAVCYALNEPVQMVAAGYEVNVFYLDQYTRLVSNGFITNDETIESDPELVQSVVRAFLRGLEDTIADPDAAFEITRKAIPEMDEATAELQRAVLAESVQFWQGDPLGASEAAAWQESVDFLSKLGLIAKEPDAADLFTNAFVE